MLNKRTLKHTDAVIANLINCALDLEQHIFQSGLSISIFYCYIVYNNKMINCISESEIDGECVDKLLKDSIKDIQTGLCNTEMALLRLVDNDEINPALWLASYECNIQLINLVKELNIILKEIKPSAKALKIAHNKIDECVEKENRH